MGSTLTFISFLILGLPLLAAADDAPGAVAVVVVEPECPVSTPQGGEQCATPGLRCKYNIVCCPTCPHACVSTFYASCSESKSWSVAVAKVACPPLGGCPPAPAPASPRSATSRRRCPRRPPPPWSPCKKAHQRCKWGRGCCRCNRSKCWSSTTRATCSARGRKWVVSVKPRPVCPRSGPDCPPRTCPRHTPAHGSRCKHEGRRCTYGRFCCGCEPSQTCFPTKMALCSAGSWVVSSTLLPRCATCLPAPSFSGRHPPHVKPLELGCPKKPFSSSLTCTTEGLHCGYNEFCCPCSNDCYNTTLKVCQGGKWYTVAQDPVCALSPSDCAPPPAPPRCPALAPAPLSACQKPGMECGYNRICCGCTKKRCFNTRIYTCSSGKTWDALAISLTRDCVECP